MTLEDKQLLLKDLCSRLPYGVKVQYTIGIGQPPNIEVYTFKGQHYDELTRFGYKIPCDFKPFLRPMSSMTEEEIDEFTSFDVYDEGPYVMSNHKTIDWLNAHHFDYRGLIEKGLAIEAPEGMYNETPNLIK